MLLWDIIRDWFVMNIWGGVTSNGDSYNTVVGNLTSYFDGEWEDGWVANNTDVRFLIFSEPNRLVYIDFSDWLSTTSTIIVLVAISIVLYFLVRYFFRMFAGLLSGR